MMDPARKNTFLGGELVFTKRLSNKWMANAAFTWQTQKAYYGSSSRRWFWQVFLPGRFA